MVDLIEKHVSLFSLFSKVYIFGSSINSKYPNDIDLLLIYKSYSNVIQQEKNTISSFFEELSGLPIDITILSEEEVEETKFLERLSFKYQRMV